MKFEEMVQDLSQKYEVDEERTYFLLSNAETRLFLRTPGKYLFNYRKQREDAYELIDRYLSINKVKEQRYQNIKKIRQTKEKLKQEDLNSRIGKLNGPNKYTG
jgi:hypothetical protein